MLNNLTSNSTKSQAASQRERSNTQGRLQSVIHPNQQLQKKVDKIYQPKKPFFFFFFLFWHLDRYTFVALWETKMMKISPKHNLDIA